MYISINTLLGSFGSIREDRPRRRRGQLRRERRLLFETLEDRRVLSSVDFGWALAAGSTGYDLGQGIATDAAGNVYVTGHFQGTVDFDPGPGVVNLTSDGDGYDIFVSKLDSRGNFVWARAMGGTGYGFGHGIAVDGAGNVYTTGGFQGTADFDPGPGTFHLTSRGGYDIFVSKLDNAGSFVWARAMGGTSHDIGYGIAVDGAGNVYTTGYFQGTADFDPGMGTYNLTSSGDRDIFVSKLDSTGNFVWARAMGGTSSGWAIAIAVDGAGNVYTTGYFQGTVDFDPRPGTFNLTSRGGYDVFVSKLDSAGNFVWARAMGGTGNDSGYGIAVDGAGNVYTTGSFEGIADFDPGASTFNLTGSDGYHIFVSKLDSAGDFVWAKAMGGTGWDYANGIAVDGAGNVYTTGGFEGIADFDPGASTFNLTSSGDFDIFVSKLDSAGNFVWARAMGGTNYEWGYGIAVDGVGNVYTTGGFQGTADFDPGPGTFHLTSSGGSDIFVSKLTQTQTQTLPSEILARGVAYLGHWEKGHHVCFDGQCLGYVVDKVFEHWMGFYGLGLLSAVHGPALVVRGTDQWRDLTTNLHREGVGWPQFDAMREEVSVWLEEQTEAVDMIGHSLGGALAHWFAAEFTEHVDQLVTFNSPGIPASHAEKFVPSDTTSVTHYIVNGDVVSIFGQAFLEGAVQMGSFSDLNLLNKHSLPLLEPRIWNPDKGQYRERPDDLSWETISTDELNSPWFSFTDRDYRLWLLGMQVALRAANAHALTVVPSLLKTRGTADASRTLIGHAIDLGQRTGTWVKDATGRFVLETRDLVHALYNQFRPIVSSDFELTVEDDALRFDGGLSVALGDSIHVRLPWFLGGGEITAEHLVSLVDLDHHGKIDAEGLEVHGQLALLGSLLQVQGSAILDWRKTELNVAGSMDILDGFINTNSVTKIGANGHLVLGGGAQIQVPASCPWIGGTTLVGGQFLLNYANRPDPFYDFVAGWGTLAGVPLGIRLRFNGDWDLLGARKIEQMVPTQGSGASSSPLQPQSDGLEIPANRDWALFFLQWEEPSADVAFQLQTPSGQVLGEAEIEAEPSMSLVAELSSLRRKVIRVEQPEAGVWELRVEDPTGLGDVSTTAMVSEPAPAVEVLAVSSGLLREPIELEVAVSGAESQVRVALFYDTDAVGLDGVMIVDGLVPDHEGRVHFTWDTAGVAAGEYYVYARAMDEVNVPVAAYADAPVEISDPVPEVASLAADLGPVIHSAALTLTAEVAFEPIDDILQVEFYRGDDLLGADADGTDGWTWTADTADWPLGEQPVTARAQTIGGVWSDWDSATVTLIENPAQIHMTIAAEPSTTGDGGQVASLPNSVDWVHEWQSFWVEVWVGAPDMPTLAAAGATVDLRYNADYLTALEIEYGSAFPLDRTGTLEDGSGLVGGIGGAAGASAVSTEGYLLLARVRFASTGDDQLPVDEIGRNIGPYDMQIELTEAQTKWVDAGTVVPELGGAPVTELWAVMYDMDDNNRIDFGDLSYFAPAFGLDVGPPESQPPYVWWADFDKSGRVDFGDLSFFAPNFAKRRELVQSDAQTLTFPPNFPAAWRAVPSVPGGEGEAMSGGEMHRPSSAGAGMLVGFDSLRESRAPSLQAAFASEQTHATGRQERPATGRTARVPAAADAIFAQVGIAEAERTPPSLRPRIATAGDESRRIGASQEPESPVTLHSGTDLSLAALPERVRRWSEHWEPLEDLLSLLADQPFERLLNPHDTLFAQE